MQAQLFKLILPAFLFLTAVIFILIYGIETVLPTDTSGFQVLEKSKGGIAQRPDTLESITVEVVDFSRQSQGDEVNLIWKVKAAKIVIELDIREFEEFPLTNAKIVASINGQGQLFNTKTNKNGIAEIAVFSISPNIDIPRLIIHEIKGYKCINCPLSL